MMVAATPWLASSLAMFMIGIVWPGAMNGMKMKLRWSGCDAIDDDDDDEWVERVRSGSCIKLNLSKGVGEFSHIICVSLFHTHIILDSISLYLKTLRSN